MAASGGRRPRWRCASEVRGELQSQAAAEVDQVGKAEDLCGTALLDRLWAYNQNAPPLMRFNVRVVVNMGEVRLDRGDIYGEPVNVAARVEDVALGGDVTLTEAVFLTMNRSEVEMEPLGSHTLKGLPEDVTLYRVKHLTDRPPEGELAKSYPFGGTQLHRLNTQAPANAAITAQLSKDGKRGMDSLKDGARRARSSVDSARDALRSLSGGLLARLAVVGLVLAGGGFWGLRTFMHWREDPFRPIEERLAASDVSGALSLIHI